MREAYTFRDQNMRGLPDFVATVQVFATAKGLDLEDAEYSWDGKEYRVVFKPGIVLNTTTQTALQTTLIRPALVKELVANKLVEKILQ